MNMFTGIVTDVGTVEKRIKTGDTRFIFKTIYDTSTIDFGASIACSGVCLTVVDKGGDWFAADVSEETLSCTNLNDWSEGTKINLERALKVGDELGGHIVTGHVDEVGEIMSMLPEGDSLRMIFSVSKKIGWFIAEKGSVTINGVSLTVNEVKDNGEMTSFGINIIPHTQEKTSFAASKIGDKVNLEIDVLARYVARMGDVA
jgi:riboflavin synthase